MRAREAAPQGLNAAGQRSLLFPLCARRAFVWGCWHVQSPRRRNSSGSAAALPDELGGSRTALHIPERGAPVSSTGVEMHTHHGPHGLVSSAAPGDPMSWIRPCSLGMPVRAGQRGRLWKHDGFLQSFGSWRPPS